MSMRMDDGDGDENNSLIHKLTEDKEHAVLLLLYIFQYNGTTNAYIDSRLPGHERIHPRDKTTEKFRIALETLFSWDEAYRHNLNFPSVFSCIRDKAAPFLEGCRPDTQFNCMGAGWGDGYNFSISALHLAAASIEPMYIQILKDYGRTMYIVDMLNSNLNTPLFHCCFIRQA